jgi:hypothetical protein
MAIEQSAPSPTQAGVTLATYSVNVLFVLDSAKNRISLTAARFADKASFDAGKPPIAYLSFEITGEAYAAHVAANAAAYAAVKAAVESYLLTQPEFAGGTVVA